LKSNLEKEKGMYKSYCRWLLKMWMAGALASSIGMLAMPGGTAQAEEIAIAAESANNPEVIVALAAEDGVIEAGTAIQPTMTAAAIVDDFDQDPWEGFNEKMFNFNREIVDRFLLKPIATGWDFVLPDMVQRGVRNMFDNLDVVRRVVNNTLQLKLAGAGIELVRFTVNSTVGVAGFFDIAKDAFGIEQKDEDTGQTFGVWGMGPGPYLVLPLLPPMNVRDGFGYAFDAAMFPPSYFLPWWGTLAGTFTETVNERSLNLDRFERVAETTVDLYGAVRNAYLQRRAAAIKQ
jgi:phospholipid-binding lipoprotein MlaA